MTHDAHRWFFQAEENVCGLKLSCPCWSFHWLITERHFASWCKFNSTSDGDGRQGIYCFWSWSASLNSNTSCSQQLILVYCISRLALYYKKNTPYTYNSVMNVSFYVSNALIDTFIQSDLGVMHTGCFLVSICFFHCFYVNSNRQTSQALRLTCHVKSKVETVHGTWSVWTAHFNALKVVYLHILKAKCKQQSLESQHLPRPDFTYSTCSLKLWAELICTQSYKPAHSLSHTDLYTELKLTMNICRL